MITNAKITHTYLGYEWFDPKVLVEELKPSMSKMRPEEIERAVVDGLTKSGPLPPGRVLKQTPSLGDF